MSELARLLPADRQVLLVLMHLKREVSNTEIKERFGFTVPKSVRDRLRERGLIQVRRERERSGPYFHELTDPGWRQGAFEAAAGPPKGAERSHRIESTVLADYAGFLERSGIKVAEVYAAATNNTATDDTAAGTTLVDKLRAAYAELAEPGEYVDLAALRAAVGGDHAEVDRALLDLDDQAGVSLIPEANRKSLTDAQRAASLRVGGEDKHLLAITAP
ncbi:hypothetical protein [Actinokineospora pegani]|uniref:hypothetical protein n=1 Tax=Actinokineospora pegani TaxID=2654637 RepID=UPI0012EA0932|nr:hypothetical protein [Actinokineospora pegani]